MKPTVLFLLLVFITCNARQKNKAAADAKESQDSLATLTLILRDAYSNTEIAETLVIRDFKSLKKFYARINLTRKPGLPVPDIDFSKEMIIVHCSGTTDDGTLPDLYVSEETEDEIRIGIRKTDKDSSSSAVTTPFSVYRMPLTQKEVIVREE